MNAAVRRKHFIATVISALAVAIALAAAATALAHPGTDASHLSHISVSAAQPEGGSGLPWG